VARGNRQDPEVEGSCTPGVEKRDGSAQPQQGQSGIFFFVEKVLSTPPQKCFLLDKAF